MCAEYVYMRWYRRQWDISRPRSIPTFARVFYARRGDTPAHTPWNGMAQQFPFMSGGIHKEMPARLEILRSVSGRERYSKFDNRESELGVPICLEIQDVK